MLSQLRLKFTWNSVATNHGFPDARRDPVQGQDLAEGRVAGELRTDGAQRHGEVLGLEGTVGRLHLALRQGRLALQLRDARLRRQAALRQTQRGAQGTVEAKAVAWVGVYSTNLSKGLQIQVAIQHRGLQPFGHVLHLAAHLAGQPGAQRKLVQGEVASVLHQLVIADGLTCW